MALRKIVNWEGGSNARYDVSQMTKVGPNRYTADGYEFDHEGRPLSGNVPGDGPGQWTQGLPGARGGSGPNDTGPGGGGGGGAIPGAAIYGQAMASAKARYQQRVADLNKQRQGMFRKTGFQGDINEESGLVSNLRVDPFNQFGTYQLLNRAQAIRGMQGMEENISRGLGTGGGLAAQRMNELRFGFGQEDAAFGADMADQIGAFTRQQQDYKYEYDQMMYQLQLEALRAAMAAGDYGYYGGGGDGGDGGGGASGDGAQHPLLDRATRARLGSPSAQYPGAASFGGGLAQAQIAQRATKRPAVKSTQTQYATARRAVR